MTVFLTVRRLVMPSVEVDLMRYENREARRRPECHCGAELIHDEELQSGECADCNPEVDEALFGSGPDEDWDY
jgi:hypothetical protein